MEIVKQSWLLKACVSVIFLIFTSSASGFELKWGGGPAGGVWATLSAAMVEKVKEKNPDITGTAIPGPGGHNFLGIKSGRFNIAFATADASYFVWNGKEIYEGKEYKGFRHVATFFPHVSQYVVWKDSGIKTVPDLAGKRITYGVRGSGSELNTTKVLKLYGIVDKVRFEYLSFSDGMNRMKDRLIDGFIINAVLPFAGFMDLANSRPIRLLQVQEDKVKQLLDWNQGLERYTIPPGAYKGVDEPVPGFAYRMHLIAAQDVPDEVVYKVTRTLAESLPFFQKSFRPMADVTAKQMAKPTGIPFHAGALRYYKEANLH